MMITCCVYRLLPHLNPRFAAGGQHSPEAADWRADGETTNELLGVTGHEVSASSLTCHPEVPVGVRQRIDRAL